VPLRGLRLPVVAVSAAQRGVMRRVCGLISDE